MNRGWKFAYTLIALAAIAALTGCQHPMGCPNGQCGTPYATSPGYGQAPAFAPGAGPAGPAYSYGVPSDSGPMVSPGPATQPIPQYEAPIQ